MLAHCQVADFTTEVEIICMMPVAPNAELHQRAHEHLLMQVNLEPIGNSLQEIDILLLHANVIGALPLQDIVYLAIEVRREVPLIEKPDQNRMVLELLGSGSTQGANCSRDGADEGPSCPATHHPNAYPNSQFEHHAFHRRHYCCNNSIRAAVVSRARPRAKPSTFTTDKKFLA